MAGIKTCEGGVANLASSLIASLEKSSLKDRNGNPVVASIGPPIDEGVILDGSECVIAKLLGEAPSEKATSLPCPKCRHNVKYRSKEI